MTIYEFNLRALGYARQEQFLWAKFRKVAFSALWGFHSNPKKLPKTEKQFMKIPLVDVEQQISEVQKQKFLQAVKEYEALKKVE